MSLVSSAFGRNEPRLLRPAWMAMLAFAFGLVHTAFAAAAESLEVIELEHRTAAEIIPALEPLLAPQGALSGQDHTLFVRTTSENLAELRRVIARLDRAPQQLLVSVRRATRADIEREAMAVEGELSTAGARARIIGNDKQSAVGRDAIARVAVLEGNAALIDNGAHVPIVTAVLAGHAPRHGSRHGRQRWIGAHTEFHELSSGFLVMPRVNGDMVVLDIQRHDAELDEDRIQTSRLQTQVTGRMGEWLALGEVVSSDVTRERGIAHRSYSTRADETTLWVKVERP